LGDDMSLNEKMEIITDKYNRTYNIGIKCSTLKALIETKWETVVNNTEEGSYSKRFGSRMNESEYQKGNAVRLCKRDNITNKDERGRFLDEGTVIIKSGNGAVLIQKRDGKIVKRVCGMLRG
ncbi:hypothetical protein M153_19200012372, partial [Pseudoloma neurophilia]